MPGLGRTARRRGAVLVGADLQTLVNLDAISALSPRPDPKLFPEGLAPRVCAGRACGGTWQPPVAPSFPSPSETPDNRASASARLRETRTSPAWGGAGLRAPCRRGLVAHWSDEQVRELRVSRKIAASPSGSGSQQGPALTRPSPSAVARLHRPSEWWHKWTSSITRQGIIDLTRTCWGRRGAPAPVNFHGANIPPARRERGPRVTREPSFVRIRRTPAGPITTRSSPLRDSSRGPPTHPSSSGAPKDTSWAPMPPRGPHLAVMVYASHPRSLSTTPPPTYQDSRLVGETIVLPGRHRETALSRAATVAGCPGGAERLVARTLKVPLSFPARTYAPRWSETTLRIRQRAARPARSPPDGCPRLGFALAGGSGAPGPCPVLGFDPGPRAPIRNISSNGWPMLTRGHPSP